MLAVTFVAVRHTPTPLMEETECSFSSCTSESVQDEMLLSGIEWGVASLVSSVRHNDVIFLNTNRNLIFVD